MQIETNGIIIGLRNYGERALIAKVLTQSHGVLAGIIRGGQTSKRRPMTGMQGEVVWSARLESHLGAIRFVAGRNLAAMLMNNEDTLAIMNSAFAMIADFLPEREAHEDVYFATLKLLAGNPGVEDYLKWETELLASIGYSLDFSKCGGCGVFKDLTHLSPKTGRAVCAACAEPYKDKLFALPLGIDQLGHFFGMFAVKKLPVVRSRIL
ncbi:MAG: DNA repair protein RecO [Alphaproteobacteria bacterium]|nr:DNA repair protein RecO [Alphaproteobacteria bacterium]